MGFNERAAAWDTALRAERAQKIATEIRRRMKTPGGAALEFGCGTGLVGLALADCFGSLTFVDTSEGMLTVLDEKIQRNGFQNATTLCADLAADPLPAARYDVIFSSMALHHVADAPEMLARLTTLLAPGGQLLLVDLDSDPTGAFHAGEPGFAGYYGFDQAEIMTWAHAAGLVEVSCETFFRDEKQLGSAKVPYSLFLLRGAKPPKKALLMTWRENELDAATFVALRQAVGFSKTPLPQAKRALQQGLYNILVEIDGQCVGMGRLVGDGAMYWYIQDVIVRPEFQGQGLGREIVTRLLSHVEQHSQPGDRVTVGLMAAVGKDAFYEKLGFLRRPDDTHGAGMTKLWVQPEP